MGTDLRKTVVDGWHPLRAIGCDIHSEFFDMGHKLFQDEKTCGIKFIQDDVFKLAPMSPVSPTNITTNHTSQSLVQGESNLQVASLPHLQGRVKYIFTSAVFHLFDEAGQTDMARKLVGLVLLTSC